MILNYFRRSLIAQNLKLVALGCVAAAKDECNGLLVGALPVARIEL